VAIVSLAQGELPPIGARAQESQPQTPFRTGTNIVRVDATVIDRQGNPVPSLTADDFEVREDGRVQPITSFKFISADGQPTDDRSLAIRSQQHAATEAARDDVRTFLIFWDEYHIEPFTTAYRGREALTRVVLDAFGPTDLVAVMDQLTPLSAIEFTRDRRALADQVHTLKGRRGEYFPPRSAVEEEHLKAVQQLSQVEILRNQVTISAIRAAAAHLGTIREGRKTLIVITEGVGVGRGRGGGPMTSTAGYEPGLSTYSEEASIATDLVRAANDSNTAVHIIDPRGLQVSMPRIGLLENLASGSGGEMHTTNDMLGAFQRMVKQSSAVYLLGYTREMPADGKFHEIKVRMKRGGYDVRARSGYWAPRAEDVERSKKAAAESAISPSLAAAFAALPPPGAPRLVDVWAGTRPHPDGGSEVLLAWAARNRVAGDTLPASLSASVKSGETVVFDGVVQPGGTIVRSPSGGVKIDLQVASQTGEVLDRFSMSADATDLAASSLSLTTPALFLARTPGELRSIRAPGASPPIHAGREFVRTDRLILRTTAYGRTVESGAVTASLLDRRGTKLVDLSMQRSSGSNDYQIDLPLASIAAGDFVIAIAAASGEARAEALVPLRVLR
jgi:VWFA-related protein